MPLPQLDGELLEVLPLYTRCLTEFGIGDKDYTEVQSWQAAVSGGVDCHSSIRGLREDCQRQAAVLSFSAKGLTRNHEAFTELLHDTIREVRLDENQRLRELIEQICSRAETGIPGQGHVLAMGLACSRMSPLARLGFEADGLAGIVGLKQQRERVTGGGAGSQKAETEKILARMRRLHEQVLDAPKQFLLIGEPGDRDELLRHIEARWPEVKGAAVPAAALELKPERGRVCEVYTIPTAVNFCATAFPTVPAAHPDNPLLHVLAGFMRNGFLHRAIREQGGAYGAGASQDGGSASFRFYSYRDPRVEETLMDFNKAVEWVLSARHEPRALEEAVLGVIASFDKPPSPAGAAKRAYYHHLFGNTMEHRMDFRRRVLATTMDDLRRVAETWLTGDNASIGLITAPDVAAKLRIPGISVKKV